jgi:hypothetical protein
VSVFDTAHDAFNRMRRASQRGTGCHLTAEMIAALGETFLAQVWEEDDPRAALSPDQQSGGER